MSASVTINGDLNNTSAARKTEHLPVDLTYLTRSLAIPEKDDDASVREKYRPFILSDDISKTDWISQLELSTALKLSEDDINVTGQRLKVLVLYGSLRSR